MTVSTDRREAVIALARRAALEILAVYESPFAIEHKQDRSPLTAADLASHRCIVAGLQALTPEIPVLSEESKDLDIAARREWPTLWLVDPLDGTREFIKRNGEFTVNIALIEHGVATFGVIQQPVTGALWHGAAGAGAFRREGDADVAICSRKPASAPLRIAASRSHRDARTQALLDALPGSEVVGCGSSVASTTPLLVTSAWFTVTTSAPSRSVSASLLSCCAPRSMTLLAVACVWSSVTRSLALPVVMFSTPSTAVAVVISLAAIAPLLFLSML